MIEKRMTICFVSTASFNVKPLTMSQWNALAHRTARSLRMGGPSRAELAVRLAGLMDGFPLETDWPSDGFRVLAEELLGHCLNADSENFHTVVRLTASFTRRSGHTGLLRRAADLMRRVPDTGSRVRLAEIAAACVPAEHDLNPAEATIVGAELVAAAELAAAGEQQFKITSAALAVSWTGSSMLWDRAVASDHPDVRRAALYWASEQFRTARWKGDARGEGTLRAGISRIAAAIDDPDEQVAASALGAAITILQHEPEALAAILMNGLGTRPPRIDTMTCYALAGMPQHAAPASGMLRRLAASPDEDLRMAATEAIRALEATTSSTRAAPRP